MSRPTDLELLTIEATPILDRRGRIRKLYGAMLASSEAGQALWIGADVDDARAEKLTAAFDPDERSDDLEAVPNVVADLRAILEVDATPLPLGSDVSYVFEEHSNFTDHGEADFWRSDSSDIDALRPLNPGNWHPVEWTELLEGKLGEWVIAVKDGAIVSLCHTPVPSTPEMAEAGVWTHPSFRGRGYGAAVTSRWADLMRGSHHHLFYSALTDNHSSRRLAERLHLRKIGYLWRLGERKQYGEPVHPLCSLYQSERRA